MIQRCATYNGGIVCSPRGYRRVLNIRRVDERWRAYTVEGLHPAYLDNDGRIIIRLVKSRRGQLSQVQVNGIWYKLAPLLSTNPAA
ncbi:hypothetical protein FBF30_02115 [Candidatus Saccharibacteria bacterium oral taxon 955]|nr:hypothetical protein FBF30_02115 [Candidatus Saccharibacteria bacterium oral taxon 955]